MLPWIELQLDQGLESWFAACSCMRAPASGCEVLASTVWHVHAKSVRAGCPPEIGFLNVWQPHFCCDFCDSGNPVAVQNGEVVLSLALSLQTGTWAGL